MSYYEIFKKCLFEVGKPNVVKVSIFLKLFYRFDEVAKQTLTGIFQNPDKLILEDS